MRALLPDRVRWCYPVQIELRAGRQEVDLTDRLGHRPHHVFKTDEIAGLDEVGFRWVFQPEVHAHGIHVAFDRLVVDAERLTIIEDLDNASADLVDLGIRMIGGITVATAGEE